MARHRKPEFKLGTRTVARAVIGSALVGVLLGVLSPLGPLVLWTVGL